MSYFSQMAALALHNFTSAAVGIAIAAALVRGIARQRAKTMGNFWVDTVRVTYYLLAPICLVFALFLVSQGMIQNFRPYTTRRPSSRTRRHGPEDGRRGQARQHADGKPVMVSQTVDIADDRPGPDGLADRDQDARDKRGRVHECQRGPSVRESDAALRIFSRCWRSSRSPARSPITSAAAWATSATAGRYGRRCSSCSLAASWWPGSPRPPGTRFTRRWASPRRPRGANSRALQPDQPEPDR